MEFLLDRKLRVKSWPGAASDLKTVVGWSGVSAVWPCSISARGLVV